MNALSNHDTFDPGSSAETHSSDFEQLRGELLNAFFTFEVAVARWLRHLGDKDSNGSLGQRLGRLAVHPRLEGIATRKQLEKLKDLERSCATIVEIRNAAVHSSHETGNKGGVPCVHLRTIEHELNGGSDYTVYSFDEVRKAAQEARRLAGQLNTFLNQASSPPPPSPA